MKLLQALIFILALFTISNSTAQAPSIEWQKCLGGSSAEYAHSIQQTIDGGYVIVGVTESNNGDVSGNHGGDDVWVVKLDAILNIEWKRCLGGISQEAAYSIQQTTDKGYIIAGKAFYNNGDVSGSDGIDDFWIIKLSASGSIQWTNCIGRGETEVARSIQQTLDGGFIVTGEAHVNRNSGIAYDVWIVKLDFTGNIEWQRTIGGDDDNDYAYSIKQTNDGGYVLTGITYSNSGDVSGNHLSPEGSYLGDIWVVKLSSIGSIQWQKCLGGSGTEWGQSIKQSKDGGYIVIGATNSHDGHVIGNHSSNNSYTTDIWLIKLSPTGSIQWQKCFGGSGNDIGNDVQQTTDGEYVIVGQAGSDDGDVINMHSGTECWIVKLFENGSIKWQKSLGGSSGEDGNAIQQTKDGGYIVAGNTDSDDGDVSGNHGRDFWVVKLSPEPKIKAELKWDKSFPEQTTVVQGVAADGVSRIYLKISKTNASSASVIQSVAISLNDGTSNSNSPSMLGKLQEATTINSYSTEANAANTITATSSTSQNGDFWFWYVAPDDFSDNTTSAFANASEREVKAHVVATFTDGKHETIDVPIKIVRPPLVMVHGLASNDKAWANFNYGSGDLFINSPLFKQKKAVNLQPHSPYLINANMLLSPDATAFSTGSNRLNTLQGNIEELRKQGYACNQVDYVCHSMGGCVLRTAITVFQNKFYGLSGQYKNYEKGFIHKAITINTPHNNSPVADAITEFIPLAPPKANRFLGSLYRAYPTAPYIFDFIEPQDFGHPNNFWQSTLAVKDLQVSDEAGGRNLAMTSIKNHLIAGDVDINDPLTAVVTADLDKYMWLLSLALKSMRDNAPPGDTKNYLTSIINRDDEKLQALLFIQWYSKQKGFPDFLGDGDLVVPLSSQLAGQPVSTNNVKVFNNNLPFDAHHLKIVSRTDVGNWVKDLLNSSVNNNLFGSTIPATPITANRLSLFNSFKQSTSRFQTSYYDTTKVKIILPTANSSMPADSSRIIQINLKDTIGLAYIDIDFQGRTRTSVSRNSIQSFTVKIDSSFLGNMAIAATAVYDRDNGTDYHTDTLTVNVTTNATLTGFTAEAEVNYIQKDYPFYPTYTANYTNYNAGIPANSPDITVSVSDTSVVRYDSVQHAFYAVADIGSTSAIIDYKGFQSSISFVVLSQLYSGCINRTTANATLKNAANWERGVVPASCDSVVVMPGHTLVIDSSVQIRSLYIAPGATVTLADSTIKLQVGEADDGNKSFINNGSLIINKGRIVVNGSLQLIAGSNFTMTGGELILDGNTGYTSTSLPNSKNIFDVSNAMSSFSFTGGTLQIVDPPLSETSQAINCSYNFGDNTTLIFGNGVSTTASNNPNGFGSNLMPAKIGKLILDAGTTTNNRNRNFINLNPLTVKSPLEIKSGNLIQKALLNVIK